MHGQAVTGGELGHDVVAQETRRRQRQRTRGGDQGIRPVELLVVHTDPGVDDRDHVAVVVAAPVDLDVGVGRRERQRVLDQLRDHVAHVGGGRAVDARVVDMAQTYAAVALDLAERTAHDVAHGNRRAPRAGRRETREHEQRFRVTAHAGREVVEAEEVLERLRIRLVVLELADELELARQQVLVAAPEVDVRVGDAAPQRRLLDCERDRAVLHLVERDLDVVHLAARVHAHGCDLGLNDRLVHRRLQDLLDRGGEAPAGHRGRLVGEGAQGAGDPTVGEVEQRDGQQHRRRGDEDPVALFVLRGRRQADRLLRDDPGDVALRDVQQVDRVRPGLQQVHEVRVQRVPGGVLQLRDRLLARGCIEGRGDRPVERTVGAHVQVRVALDLAVGELLHLDHGRGITRASPRARP